MKFFTAILTALAVFWFWDQSYYNGLLSRAVQAMLRDISHGFGF